MEKAVVLLSRGTQEKNRCLVLMLGFHPAHLDRFNCNVRSVIVQHADRALRTLSALSSASMGSRFRVYHVVNSVMQDSPDTGLKLYQGFGKLPHLGSLSLSRRIVLGCT